MWNDVPGLTLGSVTSNGPDFSVGGETVTLTGNLDFAAWNVPTILGASLTMRGSIGNVIELNGHALTLDGNSLRADPGNRLGHGREQPEHAGRGVEFRGDLHGVLRSEPDRRRNDHELAAHGDGRESQRQRHGAGHDRDERDADRRDPDDRRSSRAGRDMRFEIRSESGAGRPLADPDARDGDAGPTRLAGVAAVEPAGSGPGFRSDRQRWNRPGFRNLRGSSRGGRSHGRGIFRLGSVPHYLRRRDRKRRGRDRARDDGDDPRLVAKPGEHGGGDHTDGHRLLPGGGADRHGGFRRRDPSFSEPRRWTRTATPRSRAHSRPERTRSSRRTREAEPSARA